MKNNKNTPAGRDSKSPLIRCEEDGTVVFSLAEASYTELALEEHRQLISEQNTNNSRSRDVLTHMEPWQEHVRAHVSSGARVDSIADLLESLPKDSPLHGVRRPTLSKWAKAAVPGIKLKAGRPPKNK